MILSVYTNYDLIITNSYSTYIGEDEYEHHIEIQCKRFTTVEFIDYVCELCKDDYFSSLTVNKGCIKISLFNPFNGSGSDITIDYKEINQ